MLLWPFPSLWFLAVLLAVYGLHRRQSSKLPLPPGPTSSWICGTNLPKSYPWRTYAHWRNTYGDIVYIYVLGNPILILNTSHAISDLLEKRSGNYSSRPVRTMVIKLMGWNWVFSSMTYGKWWRRHRRLFQKHFPINGGDEYRPSQLAQAHALLRNLRQSPDKFVHHLRRTAAAIIVRITYGIDIDEQIDEQGDNYVSLADEAISSFSKAGIFGTYLVDYVPALQYVPSWIPGASFKRDAAVWGKQASEMLRRPFDFVKQRIADGTAPPSIVTKELTDFILGERKQDEDVLINVAATTYAAGSDTVVSTLESFFLAMKLNPHTQTKAQKELESVIGDRLPIFSDRDQLPYITCVCYELLRWNPVTPLGLAHYVSQDDEYQGYRIPKGTTVFPNVWAILHDPIVYPDPLRFDPDRFSKERGGSSALNPIPDAAFGFGRRACPGRWFAFDVIWIVVASVLATYNITSLDTDNTDGVTEAQADAYESSLLSHPKPFQCIISLRSSKAGELVEETNLNN